MDGTVSNLPTLVITAVTVPQHHHDPPLKSSATYVYWRPLNKAEKQQSLGYKLAEVMMPAHHLQTYGDNNLAGWEANTFDRFQSFFNEFSGLIFTHTK